MKREKLQIEKAHFVQMNKFVRETLNNRIIATYDELITEIIIEINDKFPNLPESNVRALACSCFVGDVAPILVLHATLSAMRLETLPSDKVEELEVILGARHAALVVDEGLKRAVRRIILK